MASRVYKELKLRITIIIIVIKYKEIVFSLFHINLDKICSNNITLLLFILLAFNFSYFLFYCNKFSRQSYQLYKTKRRAA